MLTERDHREAARIAAGAGALLLELRARHAGEEALGARGDRQAHQWIARELASAFPGDLLRSEEGARSSGGSPGSNRVWIVDPLDGTREYEEGREDWAVHVALAVGGEPVAGAVALPRLGLTLASSPPPPLPSAARRPLRILVSRSRPPVEAPLLADTLGGSLVPMGSAGAKAMTVVRGEADIYVHSGGQYEWDSAAPVAVARAAGLHASRVDGSPLRYAQPDPWLPDLLICRPELVARVLAALARAP